MLGTKFPVGGKISCGGGKFLVVGEILGPGSKHLGN